MRILYVIHSLKYGGAERQLVELTKFISRTFHEIYIVCLNREEEGYDDIVLNAGIKIYYALRSSKYDLKPIVTIYRYIKQHKIQLVHTFENIGSLFGLIAAKLSGIPVVCSAIRNGKDQNYKLKISTKVIANFADILVANSQAGFKNRFRSIKPNFKVIYNGIDFKRFKNNYSDTSRLKEGIGIKEYKKVVGMVASLSKNKDHRTLLNAAQIIVKEYPDTVFLIIGDGKERNYLEDIVTKMNLRKNVIFLGYRNDVDSLLNILDVAVLQTNTDVHLEGISNAVIEAMAVGIPVIASEGGGTDEIIKNRINGITVKPKSPIETADAIKTILNNEQKAKRLSENAKIFVKEKFNYKRYVEEYENIYKNLVIR